MTMLCGRRSKTQNKTCEPRNTKVPTKTKGSQQFQNTRDSNMHVSGLFVCLCNVSLRSLYLLSLQARGCTREVNALKCQHCTVSQLMIVTVASFQKAGFTKLIKNFKNVQSGRGKWWRRMISWVNSRIHWDTNFYIEHVVRI